MDLRLRHGELLPDLCAKCGCRRELQKTMQLSYVPWWSYALFAVGAVVGTALGFALGIGASGGGGGVVLALAVLLGSKKSGVIEVPLCAVCGKRWATGVMLRGAAVALFALLFFVAPVAVIIASEGRGCGQSTTLAVAAVPFFSAPFVMIGVVRRFANPRMIWARRIDTDGMLVAGLHDAVAQAAADHADAAAKLVRGKRSVVGVRCAECNKSLVVAADGRRCVTCQKAVHHECEGEHVRTHLPDATGPFR